MKTVKTKVINLFINKSKYISSKKQLGFEFIFFINILLITQFTNFISNIT